MSWTLVFALSLGAYAFKVAGMEALSGRDVPEPILRLVGLAPPALFAALIVVQTLAADVGAIVVDERLAGLAVAGVAIWRKAPFLVVITSAVVTTAVLRALIA